MNRPLQSGFSLIELSIVLFVCALLMRSVITPLPQLRDAALRQQTHEQLRSIKQALVGHVVLTGELPCPVSSQSTIAAPGECGSFEGGVPAAVLGAHGAVSPAGALLDAWGRPIRYALGQADLRLCFSARARCTKKNLRADQLVAVVVSEGGDASAAGVQKENQDGDKQYALVAYSTEMAKPFDDLVVTLSQSDMAYWMLRGNWLER